MTGEGMATMPEPNIQIHIQVEDECDGFINETSLSGKARDVLKHLTGIVREWEQEDGDWAVIKELKPCRDCGSTAIQYFLYLDIVDGKAEARALAEAYEGSV